MKPFRPAFRAALILAAGASFVHAQSGDGDIEALREQIRQLDQKLRVLERKQELKDEAAVASAKSAPKITASDGRIEIASADGANTLRLRGLVQGDARFYFDDANAAPDGFLLRRARLIFEGKFADIFQYTIQPEYGGSAVSILDANINAVFSPGFQIRVGRFKTPIGLEQLQSDPVAFFNERSIATNLTPNRDIGIQIHGDVLDNRLNYAIGVFNGVLEGGNSTPSTDTVLLNPEGDFTVAARLFATPWANDKESALNGLGFGIAASTGNYSAANALGRYRTDGQQTFFGYRAAGVAPAAITPATVANGTSTTFSPQAYYYHGPLGILAEYVTVTSDLANGANEREVTNTAFNVSAGYVLTGEDSTYRGVSPKTTFNPSQGSWGALEIVGRLAQVDLDGDVFAPGPAGSLSLASAASQASKVTSYGVGLNWYLSKTVRTNFDFFQNEFKFEGPRPLTGALSDDELALITRVQVSF